MSSRTQTALFMMFLAGYLIAGTLLIRGGFFV